jgi:hypothetical protein
MDAARGQAPADKPALKPYRGKPAVRNFRGDDGNVGIIRSPVRAIALPDRLLKGERSMLVRCAPKNSGVTLHGLELHRRWLNPLWQRNADDASSGSRTKYETHMASVLLTLLDAEEGYSRRH